MIVGDYITAYCPKTKQKERWRVDKIFEDQEHDVQKALIRCWDRKRKEVVEAITPVSCIEKGETP